jgi:hypothetical protein
MAEIERPPRTDCKRDHESTPQGFKATRPSKLHGKLPENSPGDAWLNLEPFHPDDGRPVRDPEAMARKVLGDANRGPRAAGDAGPLGAAGRREDDGQA